MMWKCFKCGQEDVTIDAAVSGFQPEQCSICGETMMMVVGGGDEDFDCCVNYEVEDEEVSG